MSTLIELGRIREELGMAPVGGLIYLGIGFRPPKENAIAIDPDRLPSQRECHALAGLDVVVIYRGYDMRYGPLRTLSDLIQKSCPRRLQLIDLDHKHVAYLKMVGPWK